jgi:hypothetical protein
VVIFPFRGEVEAARNSEPLPQAPLVQALEERGVATIDLSDALGQQAHRSSIGNLVVDHYRPLGNTVVSRALDVKLPRLIRETCGNDYRDTGR